MASLAEMERELIVERTRVGLDVAKQLDCKDGRKLKMTCSKRGSAKKLLAKGIPPRDVAKDIGVSVPTLYFGCRHQDILRPYSGNYGLNAPQRVKLRVSVQMHSLVDDALLQYLSPTSGVAALKSVCKIQITTSTATSLTYNFSVF